jgi:hypothetical protein
MKLIMRYWYVKQIKAGRVNELMNSDEEKKKQYDLLYLD